VCDALCRFGNSGGGGHHHRHGVMVVWTFSSFLSSFADEFCCLYWCSRRYMDRFVDKHYIVLRDIAALPTQLSDALRQWFEVVSREQ
jgi:hypothetical protein